MTSSSMPHDATIVSFSGSVVVVISGGASTVNDREAVLPRKRVHIYFQIKNMTGLVPGNTSQMEHIPPKISAQLSADGSRAMHGLRWRDVGRTMTPRRSENGPP